MFLIKEIIMHKILVEDMVPIITTTITIMGTIIEMHKINQIRCHEKIGTGTLTPIMEVFPLTMQSQ